MNHPGSPEVAPPAWKPPALRTFEIETVDREGFAGYRTVDAHVIVFGDRFVQWWEKRAPDVPDFLVLAVHVSDLANVEERRWVPVPVDNVQVMARRAEDAVDASVGLVRRPLELADELLHLDSGDV